MKDNPYASRFIPPDGEKILLVLPPFWDPQIPPVGISCLKSYLKRHYFHVTTVDANIESQFREILKEYFEMLKTFIPEDKGRHMYNIGHDVLRRHMMAHLNYENEEKYIELTKTLIFQIFFEEVTKEHVIELNNLLTTFYSRLEMYILDMLARENPTVFGLSVYGSTLPASLFAFKLAKEKNPTVMTVMGGGIFSGELALHSPDFEFFLEKTPYIDKIIVGEGELLFHKLLKGELPESQKVFTLDDIDGETLDIQRVEIPDFSDFNLQHYAQMASYTSRSCPFQCSFCVETTHWGKFRRKSAPQIVDELVKLYNQYKYQLFFMCDSLLNPVVTDLAKEFVQSDMSLYWGGYLRVDKHACDIENTLLWRRGGFYRARLGVESGSQRILDAMGKHITVQQIKDSISSLAYAGIKTTTYWVIGYPGETEIDFQETLDVIEEFKDDIYEADCNPFWFFLTGQVKSEDWRIKNDYMLLYPEYARDLLLIQTWILKGEPSRQDTYQRVTRFIQHCKELGIPNPYSLYEIDLADERWKKLHKNAVPSLVELIDPDAYITECKHAHKFSLAHNLLQDDGDWL
jgi:radical SAM superfamily enzyme YgiQ (UPF0313 family)